jgi:hypothetical protein
LIIAGHLLVTAGGNIRSFLMLSILTMRTLRGGGAMSILGSPDEPPGQTGTGTQCGQA